MLEINNLHKSFDKKEILHGVSLNVKDGEIFGFIGQNGAGKTTTIKSAVGILDFEEGTILINGINIKEHPLDAKKITAYLPDNPDLYENLSGIQYLNFIADVFEISSEQREARISEYGKELGIYDNLGDQIKSLSHGMKQKVAIISAFMHDPKLLVLDEPFVGLDPIASHTMKEKLRSFATRADLYSSLRMFWKWLKISAMRSQS
jgi:ABC-2 type transport system ATP-binding protein